MVQGPDQNFLRVFSPLAHFFSMARDFSGAARTALRGKLCRLASA
jgi:hypothetical protein